MRAELSTRLEVQTKNLKKRVLCYLEYTKQGPRSMFLSRGGGLFLAPLSLLNYFLSNLFLFCKKVGGREEELKPPPSPSLCAVPLEKVFLFQTKLWLLYFNKEKALEILYNIHHMTKNESRYRTITIF